MAVEGPPQTSSGRPQKPPVQNKRPPAKQWKVNFCLKMIENQEGNERLTSIVKGGVAVFLFENHMFSHCLHSKHVIAGFKMDRLRKLRRIHCLPGLHRGFPEAPTRSLGGSFNRLHL